MKIGELAAATGVAASAIRFYEQSGLMPAAPRGDNGYRTYSNDAIERLRLIQIAQSLGFSLDALRAVFATAEGFRKDELMRNLDGRLSEIDKLMSTLRAQRRELRDLRETLHRSWVAGNCVDAMTLARGTPRKAMRAAR
jgi:DNA-binding transcriptional MerR regulator